MNVTKAVLVLVLLFSVSGCHENHADSDHHTATEGTKDVDHGHAHEIGDEPRPQTLELPEHLAIVLRKEMVEITAGMGELLSHISQGNATEAAEIADKIHNSFILKQELSHTDLQQLVSLLPADFIQMDRTFHANAAKVAEAAGRQDFKTAIEIYSAMALACVDCHGQYATDRFPEMGEQK